MKTSSWNWFQLTCPTTTRSIPVSEIPEVSARQNEYVKCIRDIRYSAIHFHHQDKTNIKSKFMIYQYIKKTILLYFILFLIIYDYYEYIYYFYVIINNYINTTKF